MKMSISQRPKKEAICKPPVPACKEEPSGLSPLISALLAETAKRGTVNRAAFSLLTDIMPYVSPSEKLYIQKMLSMRECALDISGCEPCTYNMKPCSIRSCMSESERLCGLLKVFSKYGNLSSQQNFAPIIRALETSERIKNCQRKGMGGMLEMMMPGSGMANIAQMLPALNGKNSPMGNMGDMMGMLQNSGNMGSILSMLQNAGNLGGIMNMLK